MFLPFWEWRLHACPSEPLYFQIIVKVTAIRTNAYHCAVEFFRPILVNTPFFFPKESSSKIPDMRPCVVDGRRTAPTTYEVMPSTDDPLLWLAWCDMEDEAGE